jgi:hypothetical protein
MNIAAIALMPQYPIRNSQFIYPEPGIWKMELPFGELRAVSLTNGSRRLACVPSTTLYVAVPPQLVPFYSYFTYSQ